MLFAFSLVCTALAIMAVHMARKFLAWTGKQVIENMTKPNEKEVEEKGPL